MAQHLIVCLMDKLTEIDTEPLLIRRIADYLWDRKQFVGVNVAFTPLPVISGVPQGSILGPLLFLIFETTSVPLSDGTMVLYSDDFLLYHAIRDH